MFLLLPRDCLHTYTHLNKCVFMSLCGGVRDSQLTEEIWKSISLMPALKTLNLRMNLIEHVPSRLAESLPALQMLDLAYNAFSFPTVEELMEVSSFFVLPTLWWAGRVCIVSLPLFCCGMNPDYFFTVVESWGGGEEDCHPVKC